MAVRALVTVVDDDESVRESLPELLRAFGFVVRAFSSAEEFLASNCVGQTRCLILDAGAEASPTKDSNRVHHFPWGRNRSSPRARRRCRGVPIQAIQREGPA